MKKTFFLFLNKLSLLLVIVLLCGGSLEIIAQNPQYSFGLSDFNIVDNTKKTQFPLGSFAVDGNVYTLTGNIGSQSSALWHKEKIDLAESFIFDFKLFFGAGTIYTYPSGEVQHHMYGSGVAFVLHGKNSQNKDSLIGGSLCYLGYAYKHDGRFTNNYHPAYGRDTSSTQPSLIDSSFGIMFSSYEWREIIINDTVNSWSSSRPSGYGSNIKYTKNAYYYPNTFDTDSNKIKPLQNYRKNVASDNWFCCRIHWRKSIENGQTVYDMLTYFEEKFDSDSAGQLLLRDSARFYSVGELITGLTMDSDNRAMVTFGITSATYNGVSANEHKIEFVALYNGAGITTGKEDCTRFSLVVNRTHTYPTPPPQTPPNLVGTLDTLFTYEDCPILTCDGYISNSRSGDTIYDYY